MKFVHRVTGAVVDATCHQGDAGNVSTKGGSGFVETGDWHFQGPNGWTAYNEAAFIAIYRPVKTVRVVRYDKGATREFRIQRLTRNGWVTRATGATLALARSALAQADDDETETVLEVYEDGVKV